MHVHAGKTLLGTGEVADVETVVSSIAWNEDFCFDAKGETCKHQAAYNKAFATRLAGLGWKLQQRLSNDPRLIGEAQKNEIFVEIQFGNSATLYRDYYKFQYGLSFELLSLAVLMVPTNPANFFPTRSKALTTWPNMTSRIGILRCVRSMFRLCLLVCCQRTEGGKITRVITQWFAQPWGLQLAPLHWPLRVTGQTQPRNRDPAVPLRPRAQAGRHHPAFHFREPSLSRSNDTASGTTHDFYWGTFPLCKFGLPANWLAVQ